MHPGSPSRDVPCRDAAGGTGFTGRPPVTITHCGRLVPDTSGASSTEGTPELTRFSQRSGCGHVDRGCGAADGVGRSDLRLWHESPSKDTRSNASLNDEWVRLINKSRTARQLKGDRLRDKTGYTYTFGSFVLKGRGNTAANRYWAAGHMYGTTPATPPTCATPAARPPTLAPGNPWTPAVLLIRIVSAAS
ncbi:hypothetical protein GCM10010411_72430 [Actinomadura fulvescens]|uniref:Uncharacterized protein n=1 Tax=Actinomadura fulvescens TaxID=46160 RepID=A0ABP6CPC0_9ACTN